jgi:predicted Na+-dependent transporter
MWICALGLFTQFFIMPIAEWATSVWAPEVVLPELNTGELMTLTLSLLGLGGMRSFEKSKGIARENMKK